MSKEDSGKLHAQAIRNDGGLITGAALVGGSKLVYEVGKDIYSWFRPEHKLFVQLLSSECYGDDHLVKARFASAYIQGIYIESCSLKKGKTDEVEVFKIYESDGYGFGSDRFDTEERRVSFPYLLPPGGVLDVFLRIPEQTTSKVIKAQGTHMTCTYSAIDRLGDPESFSVPIRLKWAPTLSEEGAGE